MVHQQKFREKRAEEIVFATKFFNEKQERRRQKEVQELSAAEAGHRIISLRIADSFKQKCYRRISLVTEEDRQ